MSQKTSPTLTAIFGCLFTASASAAEIVTYSCTFVDSNVKSDFYRDADQLLVDIQAEVADLRVASTMGTSEPKNWIFQTRQELSGPDIFNIYDDGKSIRGAGFAAGTPHAFVLSKDGRLTWTYLDPSFPAPVWLVWNCKK